jgi:hypothetical protein
MSRDRFILRSEARSTDNPEGERGGFTNFAMRTFLKQRFRYRVPRFLRSAGHFRYMVAEKSCNGNGFSVLIVTNHNDEREAFEDRVHSVVFIRSHYLTNTRRRINMPCMGKSKRPVCELCGSPIDPQRVQVAIRSEQRPKFCSFLCQRRAASRRQYARMKKLAAGTAAKQTAKAARRGTVPVIRAQ